MLHSHFSQWYYLKNKTSSCVLNRHVASCVSIHWLHCKILLKTLLVLKMTTYNSTYFVFGIHHMAIYSSCYDQTANAWYGIHIWQRINLSRILRIEIDCYCIVTNCRWLFYPTHDYLLKSLVDSTICVCIVWNNKLRNPLST